MLNVYLGTVNLLDKNINFLLEAELDSAVGRLENCRCVLVGSLPLFKAIRRANVIDWLLLQFTPAPSATLVFLLLPIFTRLQPPAPDHSVPRCSRAVLISGEHFKHCTR